MTPINYKVFDQIGEEHVPVASREIFRVQQIIGVTTELESRSVLPILFPYSVTKLNRLLTQVEEQQTRISNGCYGLGIDYRYPVKRAAGFFERLRDTLSLGKPSELGNLLSDLEEFREVILDGVNAHLLRLRPEYATIDKEILNAALVALNAPVHVIGDVPQAQNLATLADWWSRELRHRIFKGNNYAPKTTWATA